MPSLTPSYPLLVARDPFTDAKETLSSWDKCMEKAYCKWPVVAAIIVGSLIVLSIVFCIARCLCCGAECACCCFRCCVGCCGSGRKSKTKHHEPLPSDSGYIAPQQGYPVPASTDPVGRHYGGGVVDQQYRSHEPVQYARFESKPANEDALPNMPTWSEATSTRVEQAVPVSEKRSGDMELHELATTASARRSPNLRSPGTQQHMSPTAYNDSYGFPAGYQNDSFVSERQRRSPGPNNGYAQPHYAAEDGGYRGMSPVHAQPLSPVYGAAAGYPQQQQQQSHQPYDRHSPASPPYDHRQPSPDPNAYAQQQQQHQPYDNRAYSPPAPSYNNPTDAAGVGFAYQPAPSTSPSTAGGYAPSGSTRFEPPNPSTSPAPAYPGQQTYQAFNFQPEVGRKPVDGSWKDV